MLESSNLNSLIAGDDAERIDSASVSASNSIDSDDRSRQGTSQGSRNNTVTQVNTANNDVPHVLSPTLASVQLAAGMLQIFEPPLLRAKGQLKELIGKQNKIYIDLSAEKYKLDNAEVANVQQMMNNIKIYREKLIRIKKQMQNIYQRTKVLKKRALYIQTCKQKELQRILQKQQQEESLIGKQPQQEQT